MGSKKSQWENALKSISASGLLEVAANFVGACIVTIYFLFLDPVHPLHGMGQRLMISLILMVILITIGVIRHRFWDKELLDFVRAKKSGETPSDHLVQSARKKILEFPRFSASVTLTNWLIAGLFMAVYQFFEPYDAVTFQESFFQAVRVFIGCVIGGVITCAILYFTLEINCQKVRPMFFPDGGLVNTPVAFRQSLGSRMMITFILVSILPMVVMAVLSYNKARLMVTMNPERVLESLFYLTGFLLLVEMAAAITISHLFARSLLSPLNRIREAMYKVENGELSHSVVVTANDELGELGEHFNQMLEGLRERYRMRRYLELAMEVQQNLLPADSPLLDGFDIHGEIIYCDETGGDYFDYLAFPQNDTVGIVIGDVSDHGIPSALLMATARAFIRQRSAMGGSLEEIISDVNNQICADVRDSGRFMTLFFCTVAPRRENIHWVNAGHDSAIFFDSGSGEFTELTGGGLPLGVMAKTSYRAISRKMLPEDILIMGTDGIWECRNSEGTMFGKENLKRIVREKKDQSAKHIAQAILAKIKIFSGSLRAEDDITLVILKNVGAIS